VNCLESSKKLFKFRYQALQTLYFQEIVLYLRKIKDKQFTYHLFFKEPLQ